MIVILFTPVILSLWIIITVCSLLFHAEIPSLSKQIAILTKHDTWV